LPPWFVGVGFVDGIVLGAAVGICHAEEEEEEEEPEEGYLELELESPISFMTDQTSSSSKSSSLIDLLVP
jgi:hypothetical protein